MMSSSEEWSLSIVETWPLFPLGLVQGEGTVFTCLLVPCSALSSVLCFVSTSRCWWPVLSVSGVHAVLADRGWPWSLYQEVPLGVRSSYPKGCLSPGIAGMGPQGHIRAAPGSPWRVLWSWTLSVTVCSYQGDPFRGAEDVSNPSGGLPQQLRAGKAAKSRGLWILSFHKLQKV